MLTERNSSTFLALPFAPAVCAAPSITPDDPLGPLCAIRADSTLAPPSSPPIVLHQLIDVLPLVPRQLPRGRPQAPNTDQADLDGVAAQRCDAGCLRDGRQPVDVQGVEFDDHVNPHAEEGGLALFEHLVVSSWAGEPGHLVGGRVGLE